MSTTTVIDGVTWKQTRITCDQHAAAFLPISPLWHCVTCHPPTSTPVESQERLVIDGKPGTAADWAMLSHVRGWCHQSNDCPICDAYTRGKAEGIRQIAEG